MSESKIISKTNMQGCDVTEFESGDKILDLSNCKNFKGDIYAKRDLNIDIPYDTTQMTFSDCSFDRDMKFNFEDIKRVELINCRIGRNIVFTHKIDPTPKVILGKNTFVGGKVINGEVVTEKRRRPYGLKN